MESKVLVQYNHTDPCAFARWTTKESFQFMSARPWQQVIDFYSDVVKGQKPLSALLGTSSLSKNRICNSIESVNSQNRGGRWARLTFKIVVSYHGGSFDGWQKQPELYTVQSVVEQCLGRFVDEKKAQMLKEKGLPLEGAATVAGRTDKGVTALNQVCSFYTWSKDVRCQDIADAIDNAAPGKLRTVSVTEVSRVFHPNFSAKWRRYLYIFPFNDDEEDREQSNDTGENAQILKIKENHHEHEVVSDNCSEANVGNTNITDDVGLEAEKKPQMFSVSRVNKLLQKLEGKLLSYKMFARDTKASRNEGPPTECFVFHARAREYRLPCSEHEKGRRIMCIELIANRFLRRMIRVLVATSIREAAAGADEDALIKLMDATCRRATAPPAPPDGLCLVDVGYEEFDPLDCLISKE
ncbi:PREDICTED: uncharacterized protein LOC101305074 [Fragaria vesca subsp. vesca]|uniref:uncharacterized protein LOC101305074 n=1 Tax=Fragaria vesca subsp. vesca TaxID=101020 RepID=UPI0002C31FFB|nr:PREDICTED: uncharacterized protein LOC101305074 [Fragaria vesca subsp. vesca]